jgi:hypothetical protein
MTDNVVQLGVVRAGDEAWRDIPATLRLHADTIAGRDGPAPVAVALVLLEPDGEIVVCGLGAHGHTDVTQAVLARAAARLGEIVINNALDGYRA